MIWSKSDEATLLSAVSKASSVPEAIDAARLALPKRHLTQDSISNKLRAMGSPNMSQLVIKNAKVVPTAPRTTAEDLTEYRRKQLVTGLQETNKRLLAEVAAKEDELANYKSLTRQPKPITAPKRTPDATQRKGVPVLLCSDWHVEEPVEAKKVNGLNTYDMSIADKCINKLSEAFACMIEDSPRFDCRAGVIWLGGDLMTGYIHPELIESNTLSPQQTQVWLLDRIESMLRKMAATTKLERIIVPCNSGNHGRATDKQRVSTREANSNEQALYQTLSRVLRDEPRIEFHIADGEWVELDVMGYTLAFTHGDSFNYGGGVGGVSIPIRRGIARQFAGRKVHQYNMGHFHTRQDFGDIQINGSMIGYSPYSQRIHAAPEPRQQTFYIVDDRRGKCVNAPIWL